jgi:NAD(P)-dependent dehydrogenase (short-subunit alcohol dehydrogenase family)
MTIKRNGNSAVPKAAVAKMIRQLAAEEAHCGIRVNGIGPGLIEAGINIRNQSDPEKSRTYHEVLAALPFGRAGTAREFAEAVVFLSSSRASYISGQTFHCDGALSA